MSISQNTSLFKDELTNSKIYTSIINSNETKSELITEFCFLTFGIKIATAVTNTSKSTANIKNLLSVKNFIYYGLSSSLPSASIFVTGCWISSSIVLSNFLFRKNCIFVNGTKNQSNTSAKSCIFNLIKFSFKDVIS